MVTAYNNVWEFERDLFLFDTAVFPFFRQMKFSLRKSVAWSKKEKWEFYEILNRLTKDSAGKIYVKGAYKNPKSFEKTVNKKYEGRSIERIQQNNGWYLQKGRETNMDFIDELKKQNPNNKYYNREISEKAEQLIDNMLAEIQEMREHLANDIRDGDLPLETYDLDDRCKELVKREELMYYVLDKVKYGIMREDVIEVLENMDKPIKTIAEYLENNNYISELQANEYDLAVMKATNKYKEFDFEKE